MPRSVLATLSSNEHLEMVKDIYPGSNGSSPYSGYPSTFTSYDGSVYFGANDGINGYELWKRDAITGEAALLKDINLSGNSMPHALTVFQNRLYFIADDGVHGDELWKTDGTTEGTVMLKDLYLGVVGGLTTTFGKNPLFEFKNELYFVGQDVSYGYELWKTDGTTEGTILLKDITPGIYGSFGSAPNTYNPYLIYNGYLYFAGNDGVTAIELWRTDGTSEGTVLVKDLYPGAGWGLDYNDTHHIGFMNDVVDGGFVFVGTDGIHGYELWKSDGTEGGTTQIKDINPTGDSILWAGEFCRIGGSLLFYADDGVNGSALWKTDGTSEGTVIVKDINLTGEPSNYSQPLCVEYNNELYFGANDGIHGFELWKTNGQTSGTVMVGDFLTGPDSSDPTPLGVVNNKLVLSMTDYYYSSTYYDAFNDEYITTTETNYELWSSDGTQNGTSLIDEISQSVENTISGSIVIDSKLYFSTDDSIHGQEPWIYWALPVMPTPAPSTSQESPKPDGENSTTEAPHCTDQPASAPDLFQVDRSYKSATVHFTPLSDNVSSYVISYGTDDKAEGYSLELPISHSDGVVSQTINELNPSTSYFFKVKAQKGCMPGNWSSIKKDYFSSNTDTLTSQLFTPSNQDGNTTTSNTQSKSSSKKKVVKKLTKSTKKTLKPKSTPTPKSTKPWYMFW